MAIGTKKKRILAAEAKDTFPQATTHFPNETTKPEEESGFEVRNQQEWNDILIDPDVEGGDTHFRNEEQFNKESSKRVAAGADKPVKTKATTKDSKKIEALLANAAGKSAKRMTKAEHIDIGEDEAEGYDEELGEDHDSTFSAGDEDSGVEAAFEDEDERAEMQRRKRKPEEASKKKVKANEDCEEGPQATTHFPNGDEEPADGYLTVGEVDDEEFEDEDDMEVDADSLEYGEAPQQSLMDETEDHELNAEFEEFEGEEHAEGEPEEVEEEALEDEEHEVGAADAMDLTDVDGMDDEGDDTVFASVGMKLHVIKGNRIIASMGKKTATKAGVQDVYLSEQFELATAAEMSKHGLRAGLKKQGFTMAKVNVARNEVLNKRVELKARQVTAAVRRAQSNSNEALGQCLAIAAVGINRQYFKDTRNELRAAMEEELEAAGVRGASRLVRRVFASKGIDYAKSILTLANKLVNMPEEARNAFAEALDMTSDGEIDEDEDMYGDSSTPDFVNEEHEELDEDGDEFVDTFEVEDEAPETIHAALLQPLRPTKNRVQASSKTYSPTAQSVLDGSFRF